jgi:hypothetical protein
MIYIRVILGDLRMLYLLNIVLFVILVVPVLIYLKELYHRPSKNKEPFQEDWTQFSVKYPPALINALFGEGFMKKVGKVDFDGFTCSIFDLINRNYIKLEFFTNNKDHDDY